ncbi:Transcriptional regulator WhiB [Nocardia cerradoensis]|uniref:Transcriptional regulator WhiB n=1 Tax=Nocardia cerradoensis TaxID=85688 RepID=A0A231GUU0_9NOCA|nr:WhiB family transcriptional regulator [Nocardia cerradoensis]OXR40251.1 Transcriptional regulator WhiB [Nocardia cerradoensis]
MKKATLQRVSPQDWSDRACLGLPLDLFFPDREAQAAEAVEVCEGCPRRIQCAAWALNAGMTHCVVAGVYLPPSTSSKRAKAALDQLREIAESGAAADVSDQEGGTAWTAA